MYNKKHLPQRSLEAQSWDELHITGAVGISWGDPSVQHGRERWTISHI